MEKNIDQNNEKSELFETVNQTFEENDTIFHDYDNYEYYAVDLILKNFKNFPNESNLIKSEETIALHENNAGKCVENPNYNDLNKQHDTIDNIKQDNSIQNTLRSNHPKENVEQSFILYDES
ncbi:unnamed protein product [Brachionus calyciflorus]|uniref:Uncharacterized protein n=1 Tax=Brachionus calyciflorus TaxID=104777 RepID=A0A813Q4P0_9BILA|nr:unnamed protein product [Brachionus calyciflorus]